MSNQFDWQILDRFLAGEASPEDEARVRAWMSASPERRAMVESLQQQQAITTRVDVDRAWQRVAAQTVRPARSTPRWGGWVAAAAAVLTVGSIATFRLWRPAAVPTHVATTWREITAPLGKRASVTLPDSSTVVLNAGSTLRYVSIYGATDREVQLRGEAYFVVRHDAAHPFRVRANNAVIQDVGTRFVVRAYDDAHGTIVVVAEGAVGVARAGSTARDTVVVNPGVLARMTTTGAITTTAVDAGRYTGFSRGLLVLGISRSTKPCR